jgi:hypothetical protein
VTGVQVLFDMTPGTQAAWGCLPEWRRFLMITRADEHRTPSMTLVVNWPALMKK